MLIDFITPFIVLMAVKKSLIKKLIDNNFIITFEFNKI